MKKHLVAVLSAGILFTSLTGVLAHEGDDTHAMSAQVDGEGMLTVAASAVVPGTVRALKAVLLDLERWPVVFSDVRALSSQGGPWSVDFVQFGHPHDFDVSRNARGVVLELADADHGLGRFEYRLAPLDAARSTLTVRYAMGTPPGLTAADALAMLQLKAIADLEDFAKAATTAE